MLSLLFYTKSAAYLCLSYSVKSSRKSIISIIISILRCISCCLYLFCTLCFKHLLKYNKAYNSSVVKSLYKNIIVQSFIINLFVNTPHNLDKLICIVKSAIISLSHKNIKYRKCLLVYHLHLKSELTFLR